MTGLGCLRAGTLIDRRAVGLSTADALRLEEHLTGCEACGEQAKLFARLRAVAAQVNTTLTPVVRERVIASALASAQREPVLRLHVRSWRPAALALAAAVLFGLGLRVMFLAPPSAKVAAVSRSAPGGANGVSTDRVLAGAVQMQGEARVAGAALADDVTLQSAAGATLALAQAKVELRPGTSVRWSKRDHTLRLEAGSVVADVDPSAHARFVIQTARFSVVVLGTRFEVSLDGVSVTRGRVQVLATDGRALVQLGAGERFVDKAPGDEGSIVAQPRHTPGDVAALLAEARAQVASKHVTRAKQLIDAALTLPLDATARAEALTLRAECALVDGDKAAAVSAYLRVARTFAQLAAGENALFAAARIEAERNQRAAATRWLTRYLERYPSGRFVQEARARLRELTESTDHAP